MLQGQVNGNVGWIADQVKEKDGRHFLAFTVAHNYGVKNAEGGYDNHTQWVHCFLSGKPEYLEKQRQKLYSGAVIFVQGPISTSMYTKNGVAQASLSLSVDKMEFKTKDAEQTTQAAPVAEQPTANDFPPIEVSTGGDLPF